MSGDFWGSQEGCQGPFRTSGLKKLVIRNHLILALVKVFFPGQLVPLYSVDLVLLDTKMFVCLSMGMLQTRILGCVAMRSPRGSSEPPRKPF